MESTANDGQGPHCDGQEGNAPAAAASLDNSFAQDSAVSSLSPNNSPERTHNATPPDDDTGPSLADSPEASPAPSPPPIRSVGTEENMDMVESLSRVRSTRRTNRSAAAAAAAAAEEERQGAIALFHAGGHRPGPGIPPRRMGRPPLSPAFGAPPQHAGAVEDGAEESAATSTSGKYMSPAEISLRQEEASFYGAPANEAGDDNIWGLLSGVMGNIYEWYDFAVYGLMAAEIGAAFFPQSSKELQLINSFGVYLAAFVMRPLGAIAFGELGDRLVGRKNALVFSIVLITVPSALMGVLPTYQQWGFVAPICLVLLRMVQGLSVGGQLAGSYVLSIEQSSANNRGFRGSVCDASSVGGFLLASFVSAVVRYVFTGDQVDQWAWRVPFLFSIVLAPILYTIVKQTGESKHWEQGKENKKTEKAIRENEQEEKSALSDLLSSPFRRRQLMGMIFVLAPLTSSYYMIFLWAPVYLSQLRGLLSEADATSMNVLVIFCYIVMLLISGKLSDTFPHRMDLIRIGLPGIIVAAPAMFGMYESESVVGYFLGQLQYAACLSLFQGGMAAWKVELWMSDPTLSYTGVAVGHNVASCIFGGTLPLVATFLYYRSREWIPDDSEDEFESFWPRLVPGLYISILACLSLYSISFIIRHPHDIRTGEKKLRDAYEREVRRKLRRQRKNDGISPSGSWGISPSGSWPLSSIVSWEDQSDNKPQTEAYVPPSNL